MRIGILSGCAALALAGAATARDLPVPADKGWQHADSGLILPAKLDGLTRTKLVDATTSERDVTANFDAPAEGFAATVYIFHPAIDSVPIWFDRIQAAIGARDLFGGVTASSPNPIAFAPPGQTVASAFGQSYQPSRRANRGTAVAVMPLGEWLVVVRASSTKLSPAETDARMHRVIAAMRWPRAGANGEAPAAVPIAACPSPLRFTQAKHAATDKGPDVMMALLSSMVSRGTKGQARERAPLDWCRDPAGGSAYGVYRGIGEDKGYTMAISDAGRSVSVVASLDTQMGKGNGYSVSLNDVDGTVLSFPTFEGMPSPDQVMDDLRKGPTSRINNVGNRTNISLLPQPK